MFVYILRVEKKSTGLDLKWPTLGTVRIRKKNQLKKELLRVNWTNLIHAMACETIHSGARLVKTGFNESLIARMGITMHGDAIVE